MTLGIIDVGTNSIHLLTGRGGGAGAFRTIRHEQHLVRLGAGGLVTGALTSPAMRRALTVLQRYTRLMQRDGVDRVEAVATSAVREASNGRAFVRRVRRQLRLPLRMISGEEEARLIYLGVHHQHPLRRSTLLLTIGGGSAQVICGDGGSPRYLSSVRLGAARLAQRFLHHDPPQRRELEALRRHVRRVWAPVIRSIRRYRWRQALAGSAMIDQVVLAACRFNRRDASHRITSRSIDQPTLRRLVDWLSVSTTEIRKRLRGIDPRRQELLLPTALTLLAWMEGCRVLRVRRASGSLREGLVTDHVIRYH